VSHSIGIGKTVLVLLLTLCFIEKYHNRKLKIDIDIRWENFC